MILIKDVLGDIVLVNLCSDVIYLAFKIWGLIHLSLINPLFNRI